MITLSEAKEHLRINVEDSDSLITSLIGVATEYLAKLGCNTDADPIPAPVQQAGLLIVSYLYDGEDDLLTSPFSRGSLAVDTLTAPYRNVDL